MDYRSDFEITITDMAGNTPHNYAKIFADLSAISEYQIYIESVGFGRLSEAKWYDCVPNMEEISKAYPEIRFTVEVEGEDGAKSIVNALAGDVVDRDGEVVYEPNTLWDESDKPALRLFEVDFNDAEEHTLMVKAETPEEAVQLAAAYYEIENNGFDVVPVAHENNIRIFELQTNDKKGALGWHTQADGGAVIEVANATMKEPV